MSIVVSMISFSPADELDLSNLRQREYCRDRTLPVQHSPR